MGFFSSIFSGSSKKSNSSSCSNYRVKVHPMASGDCQRKADFKIGYATRKRDEANAKRRSR